MPYAGVPENEEQAHLTVDINSLDGTVYPCPAQHCQGIPSPRWPGRGRLDFRVVQGRFVAVGTSKDGTTADQIRQLLHARLQRSWLRDTLESLLYVPIDLHQTMRYYSPFLIRHSNLQYWTRNYRQTAERCGTQAGSRCLAWLLANDKLVSIPGMQARRISLSPSRLYQMAMTYCDGSLVDATVLSTVSAAVKPNPPLRRELAEEADDDPGRGEDPRDDGVPREPAFE